MATNWTVSDLFRAKEVFDQKIDAAVDAVLADLTTDKLVWKRNMVRTAILLAHPVKG